MRSERSDVRTGSQNAQLTPSDSRRGLPPAALKPSYSPRTAKAPSLHWTPAPAAKLLFVRLMGRNSGANRQEGQTRSRPALLRSEAHTSELQSTCNLVCRLLLEKKMYNQSHYT